MNIAFTVTAQEHAVILAALRYWQRDQESALDDDGEDWTESLCGDAHFTEHAPLSVEELDGLCERINAPDSAGPLATLIDLAEEAHAALVDAGFNDGDNNLLGLLDAAITEVKGKNA